MKKYFITGLVILLPVTVTLMILVFVVNFLTKPFMGFVTHLLVGLTKLGFPILSTEPFIRYTSQILILIALFLLTISLGFFARGFFFHTLIKWGDAILHRIPLVNKVYKTSQEIIKTLFVTDKNSFKQVVLVPFPNRETYTLGLVSRNSPKVCRDKVGADLISVFVATTPNPTTGFLMMYKREDLIFIDMKTEDAVKYIVSCGVIIPDEELEK